MKETTRTAFKGLRHPVCTLTEAWLPCILGILYECVYLSTLNARIVFKELCATWHLLGQREEEQLDEHRGLISSSSACLGGLELVAFTKQ